MGVTLMSIWKDYQGPLLRRNRPGKGVPIRRKIKQIRKPRKPNKTNKRIK